ncbi:MAG: hypothetical protein ACLFVU_02530 [Phycisphaerae bacterium]
MDHSKLHWLEKFQTQLAAVLVLAAMYFLIWPLIAPADPQAAVTFLPQGLYAEIIVYALAVWVLSALVAVLTIHARPESAMVATLIGAGGIALRSSRVRFLYMFNQDSLGGVFLGMIFELLILAIILIVASAIITFIRSRVESVKPRWVRKPKLEHLPEAQRMPVALSPGGASVIRWLVFLNLVPLEARPTEEDRQPRKSAATQKINLLHQSVQFLAVGAVVAVLLLGLLLRSPDRGQVVFAVLASFTLGTLAAELLFPTPLGVLAWLLPLLAGIVCCLWGAVTPVPDAAAGWAVVPLQARALPIDWMTFGVGGAFWGYWMGLRMHERWIIEKQNKEVAQTQKN